MQAVGIACGTFMLQTGGGKAMGSDGILRVIGKVRPSYICGIPGYTYHLLREGVEQGRDFSFVKTLFLGGDRVTPDYRTKLCELLRESGATDPRVVSILLDERIRGAVDPGLRPGHHDDLGGMAEGVPQCSQDGVGAVAGPSEDDDRGGHRGRFRQPRGYRPDRAIACLAVGDDVGRASRLEVVARAEVDDPPARGLDASLQLVGGAVVALDARGSALVGERDDVVGY